MDNRVHGVRAEENQHPVQGRKKAHSSKFPVLKRNRTAFRNPAGWLSVFLTEKTELMLAFVCQHEVSVTFGSSNSTVDTPRESFRDQLCVEPTLLAYKWSVGQGSHYSTLMLLSSCYEGKPRLGSRTLEMSEESPLQANSKYNQCLHIARPCI